MKLNFKEDKNEKEISNNNYNKIIIITMGILFSFAGCSESSRVSHNLSQEADNFNVVRQLTVINCIQGDVLFQMTGKLSIQVDTDEHQLEVTVENSDGTY